MFRVKICGVTSVADARAAVDAGADAIGLNFYAKSPRCVAPEVAAEIGAAVGDSATLVGVFVNASVEAIAMRIDEASLHAVQLHGDEPPEVAAAIHPSVGLVRAFRCGDAGLGPLAEWIAQADDLGRKTSAALVDAPGGRGEYGGTGRSPDWTRVASDAGLLAETPLILAGGLKPENVAGAIRAVSPAGVDTASGVESAPGIKDGHKVRRFVAAARAAFAAAE